MLNFKPFLLLCLFANIITAQQNKLSIENHSSSYSNWESFFSYNLISGIDSAQSKIYFASYNSIFSYDIYSFQTEKFDTLNGLSGDEISAFYHSESNDIIAIGYKSGFLQIIDLTTDTIINIYDILNKPTIPANSKKINHFSETDSQLIISTGYGI